MYDHIHLPTIDECVRALDWPTEQWRGQCYGVALALVKSKLIPGRAVYGHYYGPIARTSNPFGARAGTNFPVHHGWIIMEDDETICDPTRWVFEDREPYLYYLNPCNCDDYGQASMYDGEEHFDVCWCDHVRDEHRAYGFFRPCKFNGDDYDEGCQRWLEDNSTPPPGDELNLTKRTFDLPLTGDARRVVYSLLNLSRVGDDPTRPLPLSIAQAMWLAHLPVDSLGIAARPIYDGLRTCGAGAFIPIDSQKLVYPDTY